MKLIPSLTFSLLAVGLMVRAEDAKITVPGLSQPAPANAGSAPAPAAEAAKSNFSESQLVEEFGWFIGKRVGLTELEFSKAEIDALLKGLANAAAGKDSPYELEKIGPAMDEFMQKKQAAYTTRLKTKSLAANADF